MKGGDRCTEGMACVRANCPEHGWDPVTEQAKDYRAAVEAYSGGDVTVEVSGWGYWNVWVKSHDTPHLPETILDPRDSFKLAWHLVRAGLSCWWRQLPDRLAGRIVKRDRASRSDGFPEVSP